MGMQGKMVRIEPYQLTVTRNSCQRGSANNGYSLGFAPRYCSVDKTLTEIQSEFTIFSVQ